MNQQRIREIQEVIGTSVDGRWGRFSQAAVEKHLRSLLPDPYPYPKSYREMFSFYGEPGDTKNFTRINTSSLDNLLYDGKRVRSIECHKKIATNLLNFLTELNSSEYAYVLRKYGGCYVKRKVRGGTNWSDHAWACAIDLDVDKNKLKWHWPMQAQMPLEVYEIAAKHQATSFGWTGNFDAMHIRWAI
jgi:hypothetical protein